MRRRMLLTATALVFAGQNVAFGQNSLSTVRIGVVALNTPRERFLLEGPLRDLGYVDGKNIAIDFRFAAGNADRLPGLAAALVADKVDLIVAIGNADVLAAKRATSTIPIIMMFAGVPVEMGLVASLSHPGGNVTGTTGQSPEIAGKILQVLHEAVPGAIRVALLLETDHPAIPPYLRATEQAAALLGIKLIVLPGQNVQELDAAFASMTRDRPDALYVSATGAIFTHRARVIDFAARNRLPAIYTYRQSVYDDGLMSYTQDDMAIARRTAAIVDLILKGAKPADIPVEQPSKYDLIINLKTARAMGLRIPRSLLLSATEVIE